MNADWLTTARQTLPRLIRLLDHLEPTYRFHDVRDVSPEFTAREGIAAVVWDVDGTLMSYHGTETDPLFVPNLEALASAGVRQAILSNCGESRFLELGAMFPDFPIVRGYDLGGERVYRVLHQGVDSLGDGRAKELLGRGAHQVRKPDGPLLLATLGALGDIDPSTALMVGDQFLTDVATGNLAGARSGKLPAWAKDTFPATLRVSQGLERLLYRISRLRGPRRSA
ncbi:MAG: HAD hydrolase-like protein [Candidatus Eisenbacteria bacterium]